MKKSFFLFCFILMSASVFSQTFYGKEAQAIVSGSEMVVKDTLLDIPTFIMFAKGSEVAFKEMQPWMVNHFNINPDYNLKLIRSEKDDLGYTHYRYQQTYKEFPIHSNIFIVHVKNNLIVSMNGQLFSKTDMPADVTLTEAQALDNAIEYVGAESYKWQIPGEERILKYTLNDESATYFPKGELIMVPSDHNFKSGDYHLTYRFDIYAHKPMSRQWIFVDASTGKIIMTLERIHTENEDVKANATGSAATKYNGTRTIITDYTGSTYRLRETGRGLGIETYDMNVGTNYGSAVDFTDADNNWTGTNAQQDEVARDAHWGTEMTYDYFYLIHQRNSINGTGFKLLSYVHANLVGMGYQDNINAFWDGSRMTYGDGGSGYSPLTTLDVCAHEITHGLTENTANLNYSNESGALNEGFSDIFGASVEFYSSPPLQTGNWLIGEDIGDPFRSMSNPNLYDQPDTYLGDSWYTGTGDNGGVHYNSGVINFWYYLLCEGGSGTNDKGNAFNVTSITMAKAERIAFRTLTVYLTSSSQYTNARTYSIQAAIDLYGSCSQEVQSTTNAWYAVGVGAAYVASPTDAEFNASSGNPCSGAPLTTQFNNLSINANTYLWNFGDGSTSTLANPSHTYNTNGTYSVKLVAYGGTCGTDSIVKTGFINVGISTIGDTICGPATAQLHASGSGILKWYDSPTSTTVLYTGTTFTTPLLSTTTNYYVKDSIVQGQTYYGGRPSRTTTNTSNIGAEQGLIFTALQPFLLKSVKVYSVSSSTANRTIYLKNSSGDTISTIVVSVPPGESRLTLNLNVPVGTNMKLTAPTNSYLMRENITAGGIYPLTIPDVLSITTSTAQSPADPLKYYYYFYDWEVKLDCVSPKTEVTAIVNPLPTAAGTISGTANVCHGQTGVTYTVPAISNATAYLWTLPSGVTGTSTTNSINVDFSDSAVSGTITVKGVNDCGNGTASSFAVNVSNNTASTISESVCGSYTAPDGVVYTTSGTKTAVIDNYAGCDSTITINLTVNQNSAASITESVCESYTAPDGAIYTTSGTKTAVIDNIAGCDSTITINLTVNQNTAESITESVCESYTAPDGIVYTTSGTKTAVIDNNAGCDSTITINLTVNQNSAESITESVCESYTAPDGIVYTTSGVKTAVIENAIGCDSTITINLTVNQSSSGSIAESACKSYTAPDGVVYSTSGIKTAVIENVAGCDSTITIDLTINTVNTFVQINGVTLTADVSGATYQWLDCLNSFALLAGEIDQSFLATVNGEYAVEISQNNCVDTSSCYPVVTVNISENSSSEIKTYPNPFSDELTIETTGNREQINFELFNSLGALIFKGNFTNKTTLRTGGFAPGVYLIKLNSGNNLEIRKIIKE